MKIDAVYTWVDGSDPVWNKKKIERANQLGITLTTSENIARFADNDELKYSLRSIQKFAPWINKIYIVTDNQVPKWLNLDNKKLVIVDHSEIFDDNSFLPTFSARSIETNLHRIKGLEEHFIYINDDMFFGNLAHPECFYIDKNKVRVFVSEIIPLPKKKVFDIRKRDRD